MSLPDIIPLTTVIQLSNGLDGTQISRYGEEFYQTLFRVLNKSFRCHFHKMHHDVVPLAVAGVKGQLRTIFNARALMIDKTTLL